MNFTGTWRIVASPDFDDDYLRMEVDDFPRTTPSSALTAHGEGEARLRGGQQGQRAAGRRVSGLVTGRSPPSTGVAFMPSGTVLPGRGLRLRQTWRVQSEAGPNGTGSDQVAPAPRGAAAARAATGSSNAVECRGTSEHDGLTLL
jgi:hypothetical protein